MASLLYNDTVTLEDGRTAVANFSGKLPLTWYSNVDAQLGPAAAPDRAIEDYRMTKAEGAMCGRTYLYYQVGPNCAAPDYVFGSGAVLLALRLRHTDAVLRDDHPEPVGDGLGAGLQPGCPATRARPSSRSTPRRPRAPTATIGRSSS